MNITSESFFTPLTYSENNFRKHAAKYFLAKMSLDDGQPDKAKKLLREIVSDQETTKYKALSQSILKRIN